MRRARWTMLAVCIAGSVACSDDGDKGGSTNPDGGPSDPGRDSGPNGSIDSGLDSGFIGKDATVLPDGNVVDPTPDSGDPVGPDSSQPLPCNGSCNDNVDCTLDSCVNGKCEHRVDNDVCADGSSCDLKTGCTQGKACSGDNDCADDNGCTTEERCNMQLARCEYDVLDRDRDGYPPASCGGTDCDDTRGLVNPSASESCNGRDDDCDGAVDDNLAPVAGYVCSEGDVGCAEGFENCGGGGLDICVNTQTDRLNCGGCGEICDSGQTCTNGVCSACAPSGTIMMCGGLDACADTAVSPAHCGSCDSTCPLVAQGGQLQSCINSACAPCGREDQACCANAGLEEYDGCNGALSCQGTPGAAGSKCVCGAGFTKCGDACVNLKTSNANCGACGTQCEAGETCVSEGETSTCQECGGLGERCCAGLQFPCGGGRTCGPDNTCVIGNAGGPGTSNGAGVGNGPGSSGGPG